MAMSKEKFDEAAKAFVAALPKGTMGLIVVFDDEPGALPGTIERRSHVTSNADPREMLKEVLRWAARRISVENGGPPPPTLVEAYDLVPAKGDGN